MSDVTRVQVSAGEQLLRQPVDAAARAVAAIGLMSVGIIHALEVQGQISGAVWITISFSMLAVVAPGSGLWLLARPSRASWFAGGVICLSTAIGYVLSRSVGLPGDTSDVGNWLEPLGITSLIVEGIVVIIAVMALTDSNLDVRSWPTATRATLPQ